MCIIGKEKEEEGLITITAVAMKVRSLPGMPAEPQMGDL